MYRYEITKEEKERRLKRLQEIMENENPQPRNRAERRKAMKKACKNKKRNIF